VYTVIERVRDYPKYNITGGDIMKNKKYLEAVNKIHSIFLKLYESEYLFDYEMWKATSDPDSLIPDLFSGYNAWIEQIEFKLEKIINEETFDGLEALVLHGILNKLEIEKNDEFYKNLFEDGKLHEALARIIEKVIGHVVPNDLKYAN
jgi:hypothetical protein